MTIAKPCWIDSAGTYVYGNVNIIDGGSLEFKEPAAQGSQVNFWAKNIIVENGGKLIAGSPLISDENPGPYGSRGGVLTIYLYGPDQSKDPNADANDKGLDPNVDANQGQGVLCQTEDNRQCRALRHSDRQDQRHGTRLER